MTPAQQGRHCAQCNTVVADMTRLSNEEIIQLLTKENVKCGRFYEDQLTLPETAKGWLMQWMGSVKKEWVFASVFLMLQLSTPTETYAEIQKAEQVNHERNLFPIDSGVALSGYIQGRMSTTEGNVMALSKKIYLRTASGKTIDTTTTDSNGFFAFSVADRSPEEKYYIVFQKSKKKTRYRIYVWHKTKVLCQSGDWVDFKVKRDKRNKINRLWRRSVMGCPKFR